MWGSSFSRNFFTIWNAIMISIIRVKIVMALFFSCFLCMDNIAAKTANPDDLWYDVYVKGEKYGYLNLQVTTDSSSGVILKRYESELFLKVKYLLFFTTIFKKQDKFLIDPLRGLVESSSKIEINKKQRLLITDRLDGDVFQRNSVTEKDNHNGSFKHDDFDFTELDVSFVSLEFQRPQKFRILYYGGIVGTTYNWVRSQNALIEGNTISCKVIEFKNKTQSGQRWITPDSSGIMIYEEGILGKWPYRVTLASKKRR
jgi:hypothetical protein